MGGHTVLRDLVHLLSANLDFQSGPTWTGNFGVKRLVAVGFRLRDIVVEEPRDWDPKLMHNAQSNVAFVDLAHDNSQGKKVVHLREVNLLLHHLVEDGVEVLGSSSDVQDLQTSLGAALLELNNGLGDIFLPLGARS